MAKAFYSTDHMVANQSILGKHSSLTCIQIGNFEYCGGGVVLWHRNCVAANCLDDNFVQLSYVCAVESNKKNTKLSC